MQRYGNNQLNVSNAGRYRRHFRRQHLYQRPHSVVLQQVDQAAQVRLIDPETARRVERRGRKPAKSAQMGATRREVGLKRQAAASAGRLRFEREDC